MSKLLLPRGYRNAELLHYRLQTQDEIVWRKRGEQRALQLFHAMAQRVPAYKDFLKAHHFSPRQVEGFTDFSKIPPINKDTYLRKYPKEMLCWDGEFSHGQWVIASTSGSTGEPYYFPREHLQDQQYAVTAELYLRNNFQIHRKSTLYIIAFPMGAWIGGLFTYEALKIVANNGGYDLSVITPGIHKQEVISAVKRLGRSFDQIIIGAYAPFLKDILDDGTREGVNWPEYDMGFVFSAESFTEKFRDYVFQVSRPTKPLQSTLNHYGTVDLGTMAHETPESVLIRRELVKNNSLELLFPESRRQPTLAQYNPEIFYFESESSNLLCSSYSGLPLVRYDLMDYGGVLEKQQLYQKLRAGGVNHDQLLKSADITDTLWNLPFVYVYERNDFSVSYYGFLIYPDTIRRGLQVDQLQKDFTGKFSMLVEYDEEGRQRFNINVELKHGLEPAKSLSDSVQKHLHQYLLEESSEYRETHKMVGDVVKPVVSLWPYEDSKHFKSGVKQRWVIRS